MKTCPNCNFENENNAQFCVECGTNIKNLPEDKNISWDVFEIKFWSKIKTHIYCDNFILKWSYYRKRYFFFKSFSEFYFPIERISSIKYHSGTNESLLKIIISLVLIIAWLVMNLNYNSSGIILIIAWAFLLFLMFVRNNKITVFTFWKDSENIYLNLWKSKEFVEFINQKIFENTSGKNIENKK